MREDLEATEQQGLMQELEELQGAVTGLSYQVDAGTFK